MPLKQPAQKIYYIDNLRVLLTVLVILHHTCIAYGAPGGWYFTQATKLQVPLIFMTLFVATNQAFFMGFFFFLAALFTPSSYDKKGAASFMADRLKRLGIPLLFYSFVLGPCMNFLVYRYGHGQTATFLQFIKGYDDWIDFGVLWFVAALLLFTFLYVLYRKINKNRVVKPLALPGNGRILLFAAGLGIISYLVRIFFPVGWVLHPVGFQLAHFSQYIVLFILGLFAGRNHWLAKIDGKRGKQMLFVSLVLVFVLFPCIYLIKIITHSELGVFQGNGSWQSLVAAVWEQLTGLSIITALLGLAASKWNIIAPFLQVLGRAAYATYIVHPLFVISFTVLLQAWPVEPAVKLLLAAPLAVITSFSMGRLLITIPWLKKIL